MAATPLEIPNQVTGMSGATMDVFPYGNDTAAQTGISLTEETNRVGIYTGSFTGSTTGKVTCNIKNSDGDLAGAAHGIIDADDTNTYIMDGFIKTEADGQAHVDVKEIEGTDATDQIRDAILSDATRFAGADIATIKADLPSRPTKNTALSNFAFLMVDSTDNVTPKTGLTITATRSIDGAAFASTANSASELANGIYTIDLAAADMNGDVITLRFTGSGADDRFITIVTQP